MNIRTSPVDLANQIELDIQNYIFNKDLNKGDFPFLQVSHHHHDLLHIHSLIKNNKII